MRIPIMYMSYKGYKAKVDFSEEDGGVCWRNYKYSRHGKFSWRKFKKFSQKSHQL